MRKSPSQIVTTMLAPVQTSRPEPCLYWIGSAGAPSRCWPPSSDALKREGSPGLKVFLDSIRYAVQSVLIVDPFFDGPCGIRVAGECLNDCKARTVRILSGIRPRDWEQWMIDNKFVWNRPVEFRSRPELGSKVHDRFALVDDELWHFGSTVGGGFGCLSAASRGWFQFATDFRYVFDDIWGS